METTTHPLNLALEEVPISVRTVRVLETRGLRTVRQIAAMRPEDLVNWCELSALERLELRRWMQEQRLWAPLWERIPPELANLPVDKLSGLGARTLRTLSWAKIETVGQLIQRRYEDLYVLSGMSQAGVLSIKEALRQKDLYLN